MKYRTTTFSSYLLSISKFVMIDWFTKSQHSLSDFVFEHVQNDGGRYGKKRSSDIEGYSHIVCKKRGGLCRLTESVCVVASNKRGW